VDIGHIPLAFVFLPTLTNNVRHGTHLEFLDVGPEHALINGRDKYVYRFTTNNGQRPVGNENVFTGTGKPTRTCGGDGRERGNVVRPCDRKGDIRFDNGSRIVSGKLCPVRGAQKGSQRRNLRNALFFRTFFWQHHKEVVTTTALWVARANN